MLYLAGSTRLDIAYVVHQCAQFYHAPKQSHKVGVKNIARYSKGTRTKGLIMKPDLKNLQLDLFSDADCTELYYIEDTQDPISVRSRKCLLLNFGGVPILWNSTFQFDITLSTLEGEYIAFSRGMRELVDGKSFLAELGTQMNFDVNIVSKISYTR